MYFAAKLEKWLSKQNLNTSGFETSGNDGGTLTPQPMVAGGAYGVPAHLMAGQHAILGHMAPTHYD